MSGRNYSQYSKTKITPGGYLDILKPVAIPASPADVEFVITPAYEHRPDLLAHDMYGNRKLWWVFAQRNLDVLIDPVYDFKAGTKIFLPNGNKLLSSLGV